jgi:hypothetical protein
MTTNMRSPYAASMSPRVNRDIDAIGVTIRTGSIGRGTEQEGGGPLHGGLHLMNRFTADIADPEVSYTIIMTVGARDGWLACESVTLAAAPGGPAVSGAAIRGIALSLYMQRIRQELGEAGGGGIITKPAGRTEHTVSWDLPVIPSDWDSLEFGQLRRAVHASKITPEMAAGAYRDALASPDPDKNRRPTAAAADRLGASRGHISRLLTEARRMGLPGLGPARPPRRKADKGDS